MKQEILDRLNELIVEEKGKPVTLDSKWTDAELDSLGTVITIACLEADYPFWKNLPSGSDGFQDMDFKNLTIRELVKKCVLSTTNTSSEPNTETDS